MVDAGLVGNARIVLDVPHAGVFSRTHNMNVEAFLFVDPASRARGKLRGHYAYYGVAGNSVALSKFLWEVERRWWRGR